MSVTVRRTSDYISHSGVEGMKWGYNDGQRNGKRTASELNKLTDVQKKLSGSDKYVSVSTNIQGDYDKANYMLRYLGISLDNNSDDTNVVRTMAIYKHMAATKDNYKNQYDWLKAFTRTLSSVGYDMKAVEQNIDKNKVTLQTLKSGGGSDPSDQQVKSSTTTSNFVEDYKRNKVTREAVKKHDKAVSKTSSKKKKEEEDSKKTETPASTTSTKDTEDEKKKKSTVKHSENQNGDVLIQSGVLGQKKGIRRYQYKDGSLTPLGREHYGYKAARSNKVVDELTGQKASRKSEPLNDEDVKLAKNSISTSLNSARNVNKAITKTEEAAYKKKVSKMTNEELEREIAKAMPNYEARIIREQLEQKYNKVVGNPESTKNGRDAVMSALDTVGGVALTSVAVLDLVLRIKGLKK